MPNPSSILPPLSRNVAVQTVYRQTLDAADESNIASCWKRVSAQPAYSAEGNRQPYPIICNS
jgi:hypothetical protein